MTTHARQHEIHAQPCRFSRLLTTPALGIGSCSGVATGLSSGAVVSVCGRRRYRNPRKSTGTIAILLVSSNYVHLSHGHVATPASASASLLMGFSTSTFGACNEGTLNEAVHTKHTRRLHDVRPSARSSTITAVETNVYWQQRVDICLLSLEKRDSQ